MWGVLFLMAAAIVSIVVYFGFIDSAKELIVNPAEERLAEPAEQPTANPDEQQLAPQLEEPQVSENLSPEVRAAREDMERMLQDLSFLVEALPASESLSPEARAGREAVVQAFNSYRSIVTGIAAGEMEFDFTEYAAAVAKVVRALEQYEELVSTEGQQEKALSSPSDQ